MIAGNRPQRDRKWHQAWHTTAKKVEFSSPTYSVSLRLRLLYWTPIGMSTTSGAPSSRECPYKLRQNCVSQCGFLRVSFQQQFPIRKLWLSSAPRSNHLCGQNVLNIYGTFKLSVTLVLVFRVLMVSLYEMEKVGTFVVALSKLAAGICIFG